MSGTVAAQVVTVILSPVLTRLYSPSEIGAFAGLLGVAMIIGAMSAGSFDLAVIIPEKEEDADNIAVAGFGSAILTGFLVSIVFIVSGEKISELIGLGSTPPFLRNLIGILVVMIGSAQVLNRLAIRGKKYSLLAATQVTQQIGTNGVKVFMGLAKGGVAGLFTGTFLGYMIFNISLAWAERKRFSRIKNNFDAGAVKSMIVKYRKFPLVSSWSVLFNSASTQAPVILFAALFSPSMAGFYALSHRVLKLPITLIGRNVGNVFMERAARANNSSPDELKRITLEIYEKLLFISTAGMSFIVFYGDIIFPFVFGADWKIAGLYSQWISVWLMFVLVASPLSTLFSIKEKQGEGLIFNLIMLLSRIGVIWIGSIFDVSDYFVIVAFSVVGATMWSIMCMRVLSFSNIPYVKGIFSTLKVIVPVFAIQFIVSAFLRSLL